MGFIDSIIALARYNKKTIVLPESYDPRTIEACARILEKGIANVVLIGVELIRIVDIRAVVRRRPNAVAVRI